MVVMRRMIVFIAVLAPMMCFAELEYASMLVVPIQEKNWDKLSGEWSFENGEIVGRVKGDEMGWLMVKSGVLPALRSFSIDLEFKTPAPANGGLQFRAHWLPKLPAPDGVASNSLPKTMYGYQANIDTSKKDGTGSVLAAHGQPPLGEPSAEAQAAVKPNDWNTMAVKVKGPDIEVIVNGVSAAKARDERFMDGGIALQAALNPGQEKTEVRYRNVSFNPLPGKSEADTWRPLFDGKSLAGWKEWGTEKWTIEDGVIHGSSGPKKSEGYLATEETFKDFWVHGSFKMLWDGNYGLFYHSTIKYDDKQYPVISGLQGEVDPGYPGPTGWVYESYKRGWLVTPDAKTLEAYALRPGEWNDMEIRSAGNHVTTWVNGIRVLDLVDAGQQLTEGSFALQLHAGGVAGILWKDLRVKK
ncbi:MAG: DUF1080 domain-containing protein [Candidatus Hydrogenedentes bacterium]|nr:DUF1080 domain-containing protein [Candidatus Hydrogenedentota bacterium]